MLILILILLFIILFFRNYKIEHFTEIPNKYNKFIIKEKLKDHHYLEFLEILNKNYQSKIKNNGQLKITYDHNKNITIAVLNEVFDKQPETNTVTQETIRQLISKDPVVFKSQIDTDICVNKADFLCQHINPGNYLNITTKTHILNPYKNTKLSKITDLNCWNKMYSCCIKKLT